MYFSALLDQKELHFSIIVLLLLVDWTNAAGLNCSVLNCQKNESCVMRGDLYYCSFTEDDSIEVLSPGEYFAVVFIPTLAFVLLLIAVLYIYKTRIEKQGKQPYAADVTMQGIGNKEVQNNSQQCDTQM